MVIIDFMTPHLLYIKRNLAPTHQYPPRAPLQHLTARILRVAELNHILHP